MSEPVQVGTDSEGNPLYDYKLKVKWQINYQRIVYAWDNMEAQIEVRARDEDEAKQIFNDDPDSFISDPYAGKYYDYSDDSGDSDDNHHEMSDDGFIIDEVSPAGEDKKPAQIQNNMDVKLELEDL